MNAWAPCGANKQILRVRFKVEVLFKHSGVLSQVGYPLTNISKTTPICLFWYRKCIFIVVPYTKKSFAHFHTHFHTL